MPRRPADILLTRDATGRFLPWIIALMVYLATLALAVAMSLSGLAQRWDSGLEGAVTIQVAPLEGVGAAPLDQRVHAVLGMLADMPGVLDATALSAEDTARLVEPWLGPAANGADLPLPALVDVRVGGKADVAAVRTRLQTVPGVTVEEPGVWLADLRVLAQSVRWISLALLVLIGTAAVGAVIFSANAGLAVHRPEVELLHVMGATDAHVARQFQRHMTQLAATGAFVGFALAAGTLALLGHLAARVDAALLPDLTLAGWQWGALAAVPVLAGLLATVSSRLTVMRTLERLP